MNDFNRLAISVLGFTDSVDDAYTCLQKAGATDDETVAAIFTAIEELDIVAKKSAILQATARRDGIQTEEIRIVHAHAMDYLGWPTLGSRKVG